VQLSRTVLARPSSSDNGAEEMALDTTSWPGTCGEAGRRMLAEPAEAVAAAGGAGTCGTCDIPREFWMVKLHAQSRQQKTLLKLSATAADRDVCPFPQFRHCRDSWNPMYADITFKCAAGTKLKKD
jgi:hypothetical protein